MKTLSKILAVLLLINIYALFSAQSLSAQQGPEFVSFRVFYDELSPYGFWVNYPNYNYVWIPNVDAHFTPYSTAGQWVMTEYGWTWVSSYSWGWAAFHYGRWDYDDYYGWFWIPDNEWGPSWVVWRKAHGYYGWAPLRPGMNSNMNFGSKYDDNIHWNFVQYSDFGKSNIGTYVVDNSTYNNLIRSSSVINNTYNDNRRNVSYISGPSLRQVQRTSGREMGRVAITDYNRPGQVFENNRLQLYRPLIEKNTGMNKRLEPSKITDLLYVKSPQERVDFYQRGAITPKDELRNKKQIRPLEAERINQQHQNQFLYITRLNKYKIRRIRSIQEIEFRSQEKQLLQPMNLHNKNNVAPPVNAQKRSKTTGERRQQEPDKQRERRNK